VLNTNKLKSAAGHRFFFFFVSDLFALWNEEEDGKLARGKKKEGRGKREDESPLMFDNCKFHVHVSVCIKSSCNDRI